MVNEKSTVAESCSSYWLMPSRVRLKLKAFIERFTIATHSNILCLLLCLFISSDLIVHTCDCRCCFLCCCGDIHRFSWLLLRICWGRRSRIMKILNTYNIGKLSFFSFSAGKAVWSHMRATLIVVANSQLIASAQWTMNIFSHLYFPFSSDIFFVIVHACEQQKANLCRVYVCDFHLFKFSLLLLLCVFIIFLGSLSRVVFAGS